MVRAGGYLRIAVDSPTNFTRVSFDGRSFRAVETFSDGQGQRIVERDSLTCFHCNRVFIVPLKADPNTVGWCNSCMKPICPRCSNLPCKPFERTLEEIEAKHQRSREYGG